jgi:hypothetical protein
MVHRSILPIILDSGLTISPGQRLESLIEAEETSECIATVAQTFLFERSPKHTALWRLRRTGNFQRQNVTPEGVRTIEA